MQTPAGKGWEMRTEDRKFNWNEIGLSLNNWNEMGGAAGGVRERKKSWGGVHENLPN
jgi:hypothetical protein